MFRRILVGFDGSAGSRRALRTALILAQEQAASVTAVTVQHHAQRYPATVGEVDEERHIDEQQMRRLGNEAGALAAERDLTITSVARAGHPAHEIVRAARETGADLIVIGRGDHSVVYERLLGSVAERVSHDAPCCVLIVR